jgi:hypothetical protein
MHSATLCGRKKKKWCGMIPADMKKHISRDFFSFFLQQNGTKKILILGIN